MKMVVAHLRMIKDKIREEYQIEARTRTCVRVGVRVVRGGFREQRGEERINGRTPYVPQHAHGVRVRARRGLYVLRYVVRQIIEERLVRVIREDHLRKHNHIQSKKTTLLSAFSTASTYLSRAALRSD
jgi:hypothetical protein